MDGNGILYIVNENGGGDADHPQLWVYAPDGPNQAPTAIALTNQMTPLPEDTNTTARVKVANIVVRRRPRREQPERQRTRRGVVRGRQHRPLPEGRHGARLRDQATYNITVNVSDPASRARRPQRAVHAPADLCRTAAAPGRERLHLRGLALSSGNNPYTGDWFELTNTGGAAVDIAGWKMDDNSDSSGLAVALNGVTSIPAGRSASSSRRLAARRGRRPSRAPGSAASKGRRTFRSATTAARASASARAATRSTSSTPTTRRDRGRLRHLDHPRDVRQHRRPRRHGTVGTPAPTISTLSVAGTNGAFVSAAPAPATAENAGNREPDADHQRGLPVRERQRPLRGGLVRGHEPGPVPDQHGQLADGRQLRRIRQLGCSARARADPARAIGRLHRDDRQHCGRDRARVRERLVRGQRSAQLRDRHLQRQRRRAEHRLGRGQPVRFGRQARHGTGLRRVPPPACRSTTRPASAGSATRSRPRSSTRRRSPR